MLPPLDHELMAGMRREKRQQGRRAAAAFVVGLAFAWLAPALAFGAGGGASLQPSAAPKRLNGALTEISGLAPAGPNSVYAHNDETATVYELDVATGRIVRSFSLGRPALVGDFEAIAVGGERLALITSKGVIHEARIESRRRSLAVTRFDAGLGKACEVEGFAPTAAEDGYFISCKQAGSRLVIHQWSRLGGLSKKAIDIKLDGRVPNPKAFRAADVARDARTGNLLVLDSAAGAILEVTSAGGKVRYWRLSGDHPQAEGLAIMPDGRLVVGDESKASGGFLTLYPAR
mgnify:CR=1 FL=1